MSAADVKPTTTGAEKREFAHSSPTASQTGGDLVDPKLVDPHGADKVQCVF